MASLLACGRGISAGKTAAQRGQRQPSPRSRSGTPETAAGSIVSEVHQHGVSNVPVRTGAQSFGAPQTGHSSAAFGEAGWVMGSVCERAEDGAEKSFFPFLRRRRLDHISGRQLASFFRGESRQMDVRELPGDIELPDHAILPVRDHGLHRVSQLASPCSTGRALYRTSTQRVP